MSGRCFLASDRVLEAAVQSEAQKLFARMDKAAGPGFWSRKGAYGRLMEWSMKDPAFKTQLFRFVDVLPALTSSAEIVRHLQEYLGDRAVELSPVLRAGLAASSLAPALVAGPVKANVAAMAGQFVAGQTPDDLVNHLRRNAKRGIATAMDLLGETVVSDAEADAFLERNRAALDTVSAAIAGERPCFSDIGAFGAVPRVNLSVKVSALAPDLPVADPDRARAQIAGRLRPILRRAAEVGAFINIDMESFRYKDLTLDLFKSVLAENEFRERPAAGIALQAYLRDTSNDLHGLIAWARANNRPFGVRLVKGAYWDYEVVLARQRHWPVPVWEKKAETDANYEALSLVLLENVDIVMPAFATHNVRSCAHAMAQALRLGVNPRAFEFQALYGMADELKAALVEGGHRVREYCPVGELLPGMAYLVRRLLENTSNEGFVRAKNTGDVPRDDLLRNPVALLPPEPAESPQRPKPVAPSFVNAPGTDFGRADRRDAMRAALDRVSCALGARWPLVIGGKKVEPPEFVASHNPAHPTQTIGHWGRARVGDVEAAVASARAAQPSWARTPARERGQRFERVADLMEERRCDLSALMVLEAGKPWFEADADVSEAIDFCRYYASEMRGLERPTITQIVPGERCAQTWLARGVGAVIAPWNFPIAILCGMTVAAAVGGNAVIMKPAEQTSVIAGAFMNILIEAGVPAGVVQYLPGYGDEIGRALVAHPQIAFVAFTGSRAVGLQIWGAAAQGHAGQTHLKKVVCEMGGKNALIVDADADLDEAIPAAIASAFGYSGQKCSALSRLIVLDGIYDAFVNRFLAACRSVNVGDPAHPATTVGPVIDAEAQARILARIEHGKTEAKMAFQAALSTDLLASGGYYVPPTVFVDTPAASTLAQEEIFGPVVALFRARDLDAAIALANDSEYALTAGLFSRSPSALLRAERELLAGNVYLNRTTTGAVVERHPFGGFKMSGGGTKAGGKGYIENFLVPRVIAENVLRRGFTPDEG